MQEPQSIWNLKGVGMFLGGDSAPVTLEDPGPVLAVPSFKMFANDWSSKRRL